MMIGDLLSCLYGINQRSQGYKRDTTGFHNAQTVHILTLRFSETAVEPISTHMT